MSKSYGNNNIAIAVDCDDTVIGRIRVFKRRRLTRRSQKTLLEDLTRSWYKEQGISKKLDLFFRYIPVTLYKRIAPSFGKVIGDEELATGETTSMKIFNAFMLKKAEMPIDFVEQKAKEYAKLLKPKDIEALQKCKCDIYMVSAEPIQLLEAIVREAGLSDCITKIYGTEFEVEDGIVVGFKKSTLRAGASGKYNGMEKIVSNGYTKVYALGDSMADIGLMKEHKGKVIPCTFHDAPKELIEYVTENKGFVFGSLDTFLEHVTEKAAA